MMSHDVRIKPLNQIAITIRTLDGRRWAFCGGGLDITRILVLTQNTHATAAKRLNDSLEIVFNPFKITAMRTFQHEQYHNLLKPLRIQP
jgi:hypothetical protein